MLLAELDSGAGDTVVMMDSQKPVLSGLRFYRAEPVPAHWGNKEWPDSWEGGRWGPPYSLLQGSLQPEGSHSQPGPADTAEGARPVIKRGMVAWVAGGGGPDFFIALAEHPEWGNGHTVFAEVWCVQCSAYLGAYLGMRCAVYGRVCCVY